MGLNKPLGLYIEHIEHNLAKYKAVLQAFPDVLSNRHMEFTSKSVNKQYTQLEFMKNWSGLYVAPYCEVMFENNSKEELIKIHSSPKYNRLVYLRRWGYRPEDKNVIKFARMKINLKTHAFKDEMINLCQTEIIKFIRDNPGFRLDDKHLDPRLKKLIMFV
jgi:hypothetical protein